MNKSFTQYKKGDKLPRTKSANESIKKRQKSNIVAAARESFALKGSGTTIAEIAEAANISQGLIYRYFSSKEELLLYITEDIVAQVKSQQESTDDLSGDPLEKIKEILSRMISNREKEPYLYKFIYRALADERTPEPLKQDMVSIGLKARERIYNLIVAGQKLGKIAEDDPNTLVLVLFDCIEGAWRRMAYTGPSEGHQSFPPVEIMLRMLVSSNGKQTEK